MIHYPFLSLLFAIYGVNKEIFTCCKETVVKLFIQKWHRINGLLKVDVLAYVAFWTKKNVEKSVCIFGLILRSILFVLFLFLFVSLFVCFIKFVEKRDLFHWIRVNGRQIRWGKKCGLSKNTKSYSRLSLKGHLYIWDGLLTERGTHLFVPAFLYPLHLTPYEADITVRGKRGTLVLITKVVSVLKKVDSTRFEEVWICRFSRLSSLNTSLISRTFLSTVSKFEALKQLNIGPNDEFKLVWVRHVRQSAW